MKRVFQSTLILFAFFLITGCNRNKEKLEGIWKLDVMELNGTQIDGSSLGTWFWEFNEQGGYLTMIAGAKEKGHYTLRGNTLSMKSVTSADKPETRYNLVKLDSAVLNLESIGDKNKLKLFFVKSGESDAGEKD